MGRINAFKALTPTPADAARDIDLINQFSMKTLSPEDVFCFSVLLCDNEVDRDMEYFSGTSLDKLATLFQGKPVLLDHRWSAEKQTARLYRCEVVDLDGTTLLGTQKKGIRGSAYMLKTEDTASIIEAIEGGILKEVSVGCAMGARTCSACGKDMHYNWMTGKSICGDGHVAGETYDGKLCAAELSDPMDAYELSFVAVPAQRGAGVTKGLDDPTELIQAVKTADLSMVPAADLKALAQRCQMALAADAERTERARIIAENKKFLEVK